MIKKLRVRFFYLSIAIILTIILSLSLFDYISPMGCPLSKLLKFCCPMCGTTRAWKALMAGYFVTAIRYNPIFWLWGFWCAVSYLDLWCKVFKLKEPTVGRKMLAAIGVKKTLLKLHLSLSFCTFVYLNLPTVREWRDYISHI